MLKRTHEDYVNLLNEKFDYIVPLEQYINGQTNLKHKCLKCGYIWYPTPHRLLEKTNRGCPKCSKIERNKEATKTTEYYREELVRKGRPFLCVGEYVGANIKTLHKCVQCGYEFEQTPHIILRSAVCSMCSDTINTTEKYKALLKERRPDMEVLEEYKDKDTKILHRHSCGYTYKISPNHVLQSKGGCRGCYRALRIKTDEQFREEMKNCPIKIVGKYQGARTPIQVMCSKGHVYTALPTNLLRKFGCPICSESSGEKRIKEFLDLNNVPYVSQVRFDDLRDKNKLSYDFLLSQYQLLIEFQGEQHEHPIEYFGGEEQFKVQQRHDELKKQYAFEHGYNILYIWYYDYDNIENILNECLKSKSVTTAG